MHPRERPFRNALTWILPCFLLAACLHFSGLLQPLDRAFLDSAQNHPLSERSIPPGSAILLVDEHAMERLGGDPWTLHWPWPRNAFSALILSLHSMGAKSVVLDFTFLEPSPEAEQDILLACISAGTPGCVLARTHDRNPNFWDENFLQRHPTLFSQPRMGLVNLLTDSDGVPRRYQWTGSLAAAAANAPIEARQNPLLLKWAGSLEQLGERGVPVYSVAEYFPRGMDLLAWLAEQEPDLDENRLLQALSRLPATEGPLADAVRGRTVFVGSNASGTFDGKRLPVGKGEQPGVLLHWTAWADAQGLGFLKESPTALLLVSGLVLLLPGAWINRRERALLPPLLACLVLMLCVPVMSWLLLAQGWWFPPATPALSLMFGALGIAASNFLHERARKRQVQTIFGSYVDPAVVRLLMDNPAAVRLGGERREASILFSDLAGFTTLSERLSPEALLSVINRYLDQVSQKLLSNGAYIDKYIGDAVMAVYGPPLGLANHEELACEGALAAQAAMAELAPEFEREFGCAVSMRVGVNSGEVIVGNMGSERKRNYTVLGDAVNLASRLEGANKEFGTAILLGENTARKVQTRFLTRPLALLVVKGKHEAIEVHELIASRNQATEEQLQFSHLACSAFSAMQNRDFSSASASLAEASKLRAQDPMILHWTQICSQFSTEIAPADWKPLIKLESK